VPAAQALHEAALAVEEKVPTGHGVQVMLGEW
jgi:hypothetical protein